VNFLNPNPTLPVPSSVCLRDAKLATRLGGGLNWNAGDKVSDEIRGLKSGLEGMSLRALAPGDKGGPTGDPRGFGDRGAMRPSEVRRLSRLFVIRGSLSRGSVSTRVLKREARGRL